MPALKLWASMAWAMGAIWPSGYPMSRRKRAASVAAKAEALDLCGLSLRTDTMSCNHAAGTTTADSACSRVASRLAFPTTRSTCERSCAASTAPVART